MTDTQKKSPVITIRDRGLTVSFFEREVKDLGTGETTKSYGACLQRSWRDKTNGDWKREQINLFPDELLKLSALCPRAYNALVEYVQANKSDNNGTNHPAQIMDSQDPSQDDLNDEIPF